MDAIIENETGTQRLRGYVLDVGRGDGRARCHLRVGPEHTNRHGMLHGGIVATILDNAMGATGSLSRAPGGRHPFLTISLNTQNLAPAREGEAISWHVRELLEAANVLTGVDVKRVVFNEVTKSTILEAFEHTRELDTDLIEAYLARRALDNLDGFTL